MAALPADTVNFTFTKYSGFAASVVWTLGWIGLAGLTVNHFMAVGSAGAMWNAVIAFIGLAIGCALTFGFYPRSPDLSTNQPAPPEPWHRRVTGWVGATVWCGVGVLWNIGIYSVLVQSAMKGQTANFLILIPFEAIGFFLLLFVFVGISLVLDFVFQLEKETPASVPPKLPIPVEQASSMSSANADSSGNISFTGSPVLGSLFAIIVINWFVFFGVSMYLGGDAVGIMPSRDGYVLKSHGNRKTVSESTWAFSLYYSTATLLGSPAIVIPVVAWRLRNKWKTSKWPMRLFVGLFLLVWTTGWFGGIGSSFLRSYTDWQQVKKGALSLPQTPNSRN